jgi:uncharacterized protein
MVTLLTIEADLTEALKARDSVRVDTLRGLKTRIQNEQIAKGRVLEDTELISLVRSEVKRRREAVESFSAGGRPELADKEKTEAEILSIYLPKGPSETAIVAAIEQLITDGATQAQFGPAMGKLKALFPDADGGALSRLLKEKLS